MHAADRSSTASDDLPRARTGVVAIGGGPAGPMAAEAASAAGLAVDLFDAMPCVGRKFLLAGRGGPYLTHSCIAAPWPQDPCSSTVQGEPRSATARRCTSVA